MVLNEPKSNNEIEDKEKNKQTDDTDEIVTYKNLKFDDYEEDFVEPKIIEPEDDYKITTNTYETLQEDEDNKYKFGKKREANVNKQYDLDLNKKEEISKDEKEKSILAEKYKFMYDEIKDDDIDYNKKRKKQKNKFGKRHNPKHMK